MQYRIFFLALLTVSVLGCGKVQRPVGLPDLSPCEITITQGGKPLEGADVRLVPESGKTEWITAGKTDAYGVARVSTHAKFAGAPEGTFKVLVSKLEQTPSQVPKPAKNAPDAEWVKWRELSGAEQRPLIRYVKPEYDDVKTSPHDITIAKGKNRQTFDVGEPVEIVVDKPRSGARQSPVPPSDH